MVAYNTNSTFDIDSVRLHSLGFTDVEIRNLQYLLANNCSMGTNNLMQYGLSYEQATKIRYLYDICRGKVLVETPDELSKHLRKMFGARQRIGIQNLEISSVKEVPRFAVVGNIRVEPFDIWNSNRYKGYGGVYVVSDVTSSRVIITTNKIPKIKYGAPKAVDGVLEILRVTPDKKVEVAFNKKYCKLCNRFIILASMKRPEYHHGMYEIICFEGTKIYVYAQTLKALDKIKYNMSTQRIYAYGLVAMEIPTKLKESASHIYSRLKGAYSSYESPNQEYKMITQDDQEEDEYSEEIIE